MEKQKKIGTNPLYAAVLSAMMMGGGQIYNRQLKKFAVIWLASVFLTFIGLLTLIFLVGFVFLFGVFVVWAYSIYDAYTQASK